MEHLIWLSETNVVLLTDEVSDLTQDECSQGKSNTEVGFLSANATSVCHPLDLGLIHTWMIYYRQNRVGYIISQCENKI